MITTQLYAQLDVDIFPLYSFDPSPLPTYSLPDTLPNHRTLKILFDFMYGVDLITVL